MTQFTIGLPFFNNAATLCDSVRSVFAQHDPDWNLILIDDGSTDGSLALAQQITDPRVQVISDGHNRGLAARLNELADLTHTPYLMRMDADDLMHPERLTRQSAALTARNAAPLSATDAISVDSHTVPQGYRVSNPAPPVRAYFRHSPFIHPTIAGQTAWFREHPYDTDYRRCQDQELWVRTRASHPIAVIGEPLLYLREAGTIPAAKYASSAAATRQILRQHGPDAFGAVPTAALLAAVRAKQLVYTLAQPLGLLDKIVSLRAQALPDAARAEHVDILAEIRATPVPGWPPPPSRT